MRLVWLILACPLLVGGCSLAGTDPEPSPETVQKLNSTTMSLAIALQAMWNSEEAYRESGATPQGIDLEAFWISLTATRLNLMRGGKMIDEHPNAVPDARNFWRGRVQGALALCTESGILGEMSGPISSRLGAKFGRDRVRDEVAEVLKLSRSLELALGEDRDGDAG